MLVSVARPQTTIFYSWQSDLPNKLNRGFIGESLGRAVKTLSSDDGLVVEPVVDRDTLSVPGAPDIAVTIFDKIDRAGVFVADVSIVHRAAEGRAFPNPNVLLELGYALKALGDARVILVMNTVFGSPNELPFDLRRKRVMPYELSESSVEKANQRATLAEALERAVRLILPSLALAPAVPDPLEFAQQAIRENRADLEPAILDEMRALASRLESLQPTPQQPGPFDERLVEVLPKTIPIVVDFAGLFDTAARYDSAKAIWAIAKGLQPVIDGYFVSTRGGLSVNDHERGLSEFVGHEMMVMATAILIRHHRWERLGEFLKSQYLVSSHRGRHHVRFEAFCSTVQALEIRKQRQRSPRTSLHADILQTRHATPELSTLVSFEEFIQADLVLFMATELPPEKPLDETFSPRWIPWSLVLQPSFSSPAILDELQSARVAELFARTIGVDSVNTLRVRYQQRFARGVQACFPGIHWLSFALPKAETIGSVA